MSISPTLRKLLVRMTPPHLYPAIRSMMNHSLFQKLLSTFGVSFYSPAWHTIERGKFAGISLFVDPESQAFVQQMLTGSYDDYFYSELLKEKTKGKIIYDVGAHIGYSTLTFAECVGKKGKIVAFEPNGENFTRLKLNIQRNSHLSPRILVFPYALSSKNGKEIFILSRNIEDGSSSGSFLSSAHTHLQKSVYEKSFGFIRESVITKTLDSFIRSTKIVPDIIKIDVEGAEASVLEGAVECIHDHRPILYIEIHSILASLKVTKFLLDEGYFFEILHAESDGRVFIVAKHKA